MRRERLSNWLRKIPNKVFPAGRCCGAEGGMADFRITTSGAAPTSPPEEVFRLILRKEYRRAVGTHSGRLGYVRQHSAYAIGVTAELALRYSN